MAFCVVCCDLWPRNVVRGDPMRRYPMRSDWKKASKVLHHFLGKSKETTGDAYLLWRLKTMITQDMFDVQGKVANMKEFEVKLKPA